MRTRHKRSLALSAITALALSVSLGSAGGDAHAQGRFNTT